MNITEEQARNILSPYQDEIRECIVQSWKDFHKYLHEIKHILTPRSRASIVFDFIVHNVTQKFTGRRNICFSKKRGLFLVNFEDTVIVRFKKLRNNKASCIPTTQTIDFFCQVELPEIPNPERFIVGYQLNSLQTEIKSISVIYPQNTNQNYWAYDLEPIMPEIFEMPVEQTAQEITPKEERIIIKENTDKDTVQNG